jgi:hypothetical protein
LGVEHERDSSRDSLLSRRETVSIAVHPFRCALCCLSPRGKEGREKVRARGGGIGNGVFRLSATTAQWLLWEVVVCNSNATTRGALASVLFHHAVHPVASPSPYPSLSPSASSPASYSHALYIYTTHITFPCQHITVFIPSRTHALFCFRVSIQSCK